MATEIKLRRDRYANWTSLNPVLAEGEIGLVTNFADNNTRIKIGDGATAWEDLDYFTTSQDLSNYVTDAELASALSNYVPISRTVNGKALSSNISIDKTDVGLGNVDNTNDASKPISTATQTALDLKQDKAIVVSSNQTAVNDGVYNNVANATYTDPSPVEGKGFTVFVRNGTATVGGTAYATGRKIIRTYHSGSWLNDVFTIDSVGDITPVNTPISDNDSINTFASKTQGQIDAIKDKVGVLFSDDFSTNTIANYNVSTTASISGGELSISGGIGGFNNRVDYALQKVLSEKLTIRIKYRVGEIDKRGVYFILGGTINFIVGLNQTTSSACFIDSPSASVFDSSVGGRRTMAVSLNDIIEFTINCNGFDITCTAFNSTTKVSLISRYINANYNSGLFGFCSVDGQNFIQDYSVIDDNKKDVNYLFLGDSITRVNGYLQDIRDSWFWQLQERFDGMVKLAGGGDQIDSSTAYIEMIKKYNPKNVVLFIGSNDMSNVATAQTAYSSLVTALQTQGYGIIIFTILDRLGLTSNVNTFNAWLYSNFPSIPKVDTNSAIVTSDPNLSGDYIHPSITGSKVLFEFIANKFSEFYNKNEITNYSRQHVTIPQYLISPESGAQLTGSAGVTNTDTVVSVNSKTNFPIRGYAVLSDGSNGANEIIQYNGMDQSSFFGIRRNRFATTALTISSANVRVEGIRFIIGSNTDTSHTPPLVVTSNGRFFFNGMTAVGGSFYTFSVPANSAFNIRGSGTNVVNITKNASGDTLLIQYGANSGGTTYRMLHDANSIMGWYDGSAGNTSGYNISPSSLCGIGSASTLFRLTNGGSDVTSRIFFDPARSVTAGKGYALDTTNGFVFTDANGTRRIATASFITSNVVTTAGSESADLDVMTKPSGLAMRTAFRVTANGSTILGALAALATTATDGFAYIPSCAGVPTGVPTTQTGKVPMVIDSTNNKAYIYSGGAWVALN